MALSNYLTSGELLNYVKGTTSGSSEVQNMLISNLSGVEGLPYQFMDTVDRRIINTTVGRKYGEKIIARLPLLFLTPCKQVFMDDFSDSDRETVISWLLDKGLQATDELINGKGKYYSVEFDYDEYYKYLSVMLTSVAAFLGISNEKFTVNGKERSIGNISWQNDELNEAFKTFFSSKENLVFYLDSMTEVSETFTNETTESSLASQINGFADNANEIKFLFGEKGGALGNIVDGASEVVSSITSSLSSTLGNLGGGIVESLADKGVNTVLNGGKIVFPKIWSDSSYSRSYSLNIKLRSPDHDSLSIYMNVLKPYCKLLCLALPRIINDNPNGYRSPFLLRAYSKGIFNIDMGMITSMSVTKGAQCCWNDDGLPTQIDISLDIEDLYSSLAMSATSDKIHNVVANTSYMDYLANMAGLNIAPMEVGRRIKMYYYLQRNNIVSTPSKIFTRFEQNISNLIGGIYNITS